MTRLFYIVKHLFNDVKIITFYLRAFIIFPKQMTIKYNKKIYSKFI